MGRSNYYFVDVAVKGGPHTVSFVGPDTPWAPITFGLVRNEHTIAHAMAASSSFLALYKTTFYRVTVYGFGQARAYAFSPGLSYQSECKSRVIPTI